MHPRLHIARQASDRLPIPLLGNGQIRFGRKLAPKHTELKANPRHGEWRNVGIAAQRLPVDAVGFGKLTQIRQQRAERHQIFQPAGFRRYLAPLIHHRAEVQPACLVDAQTQALHIVRRRSATEFGLREIVPRVGKTMQHRGDLRLDQRRARRSGIRLDELPRQGLDAVERRQVADKLRRELLLLDEGFGDPGLQRVLKEPAPRAQARALQVDDGNLAVGRRRAFAVEVDHGEAPKRDLRLSSPVLNRVDTIVLTTSVPCPLARNCDRHSTELPVPLGLTSSMPV